MKIVINNFNCQSIFNQYLCYKINIVVKIQIKQKAYSLQIYYRHMASNNKGFIPFSEFINSLQSAKKELHLSEGASKIVKEDMFSDMKAYLLEHYKGVEVVHGFVDKNGSVFDCIPIEKQPALKNLRQSVAKAPDLPEIQSESDSKEERYIPNIESPTGSGLKDEFGNDMVCPPGSIPVRRITLEELGRFNSLERFFQKSPGRSGKPLTVVESIEAEIEVYS